MSLRKKLFICVFIPLLCFTLLGILKLNLIYDSYKNADDISEGMEFNRILTKLIHNTQIERGKTGAFLSGTTAIGTLKQQWSVNDRVRKKLLENTHYIPMSEAYKNQLLDKISEYKKLRVLVESKSIDAPSAVSRYTNIVSFLIDYNKVLSAHSLTSKMAASIETLHKLEDVKEFAGKFRVLMTNTLAKSTPLSNETDTKLQWLASGILININSSSLVFDRKGAKLKDEFLNSDAWTKSYSIYKNVLENKTKGNFNIDPKEYFDTITTAIDKLNLVIQNQIDGTLLSVNRTLNSQYNTFIFYIALIAGILFIVSAISIILSKKLVDDLNSVTHEISSNVGEVSKLIEKISSSSQELSLSTELQVSSMQQTSATMNEIDSMVKRNTEDSRSSSHVADSNYQSLEEGVKKINELTHALGTINDNTEHVETQVTVSNKKMEDIAGVIRQIGEKTKVINDIVFQTKLLSFNASVEAERAGDNGKGFAVVAEEIGNLAQMSGSASTEIDQLLSDSIHSVERVISEQKSQMTQIIEQSRSSVEHGLLVGRESQEFLSTLLGSMDGLKQNVSQISIASDEQAKGVEEITKAIHSVNEATRNNSQIVVDSKNVSVELNENMEKFNEAVNDLENIVGSSH